MGNTDGRVYSFAASTGQLAWATGTGAYVYASAAVDDTPGLGPTIYLGSYDGNFYAFNAKSGAIRWRHPAGGKISGSATIVGNVVYYSDLGTQDHRRPQRAHRQAGVLVPGRRVQPGRSPTTGAIYLSGLHEALPDASRDAKWPPTAPQALTHVTAHGARAALTRSPHSGSPRSRNRPHKACNEARMERAFRASLLS